MNFALSEEQQELRRSVRRFLEDKSPLPEVRRLMETEHGYDGDVWAQMGRQLGLQGLHVPEAYGGAGFSYAELVLVCEEMGRALLCAPYFATVALAANVLLTSGDEAAKKELLPGLATGESVGTLALTEESGRWDLESVGTEAGISGREWRLTGRKRFVVDGHVADTILVVARTEGGLSLFAVQGDAPGLTRSLIPTMDQTRKQAGVELSATPGRLVGEEGGAGPGLRRALDLAAVALAAEEVGGAQRALDMAVDHAKGRVQFGRAVGSFQAIKHRCADLLVEVESAKSAAYYAGWVAAADLGGGTGSSGPEARSGPGDGLGPGAGGELAAMASLAKAYCSDAYYHVAADNIQIHGGIGFTWEHDAHLYFKRAKSSQLLLGDPAYHRERLAERIGM